MLYGLILATIGFKITLQMIKSAINATAMYTPDFLVFGISNKMTVKMAEEGEKFTTLDGVERTLTSDMLVIGNQDKTLDLAGIMGGVWIV